MQPISTNPLFRALMVIVPGLVLAVWLATKTGQGDLPVPIYFLIGVVALLGVRIFTRKIRLEALIVGILLFGYIVAQSGFGHFSFSLRKGIYIGEVGLMICVAAQLMRRAFTREKLVPPTPLSWAIFAFGAIGTIRFLFDLKQAQEPIVVIRDFATIYYSAFYFVAFNVCRHSASRLFLERVLTIALICSIFVSGLFLLVPSLLEYILINGRPFIEPRADLTGSFMGFACIYFFLLAQQRRRIGWSLLSFAAFIVLLIPLSRATLLGFVAATTVLLFSGQPRFLLRLVVFIVIGAVAIIPIGLSMRSHGQDTYGAVLHDKVLSIFEPLGVKSSFETQVGEDAAGNNQFRAVWWQSVIDETNGKSPVVGLGFGYDLAKRFLASYRPLNRYEFDTRSPHSILLTVYGRMGVVGIAAFLLVVLQLLRSSLRCASAIRRGKTSPIDIALWSGAAAILVASCFGVMLEGPMAAIVFWSLLGIASYRECERSQEASQKKPQPSSLDRELRPVPIASGIA